MVFGLVKQVVFPDPSLADDDGLLAVGGDLSVKRLIAAYQLGIFPWYSEGEPILWHSPHQRFVLFPSEVHISHSMKALIRSGKFTITRNKAFEQVIANCAKISRNNQNGTWIHPEMITAYTKLHQKGYAHSVEVWEGNELVGGLYGVVVGAVFCGESMFSLKPNTSKLALISLCLSGDYALIDCQTHTNHLERMGARFIGRDEFEGYLNSAL